MKSGIKSRRKKSATSIYNLPDEILKNIGENLDIADLSRFSRSCRGFFNSSLQERKKRHPERIRHNLQQLNCDKRIFNGQNEVIYGIATCGNALLTSGRHSINAWNIDTGAILWTYSGELYLGERLWVVDGKAICAGSKKSDKGSFDYDNIILVIDVETGEALSVIKHPELKAELTTVIDGQIITKLRNGDINCWGLSGKLIKNYQPAINMPLIPKFLATKRYIAD